MNKSNFSKIVQSIQATVTKHSPEILTAIGIAGMATTVILAVKATPKALSLIEDEKDRKNDELIEKAEANGLDHCELVNKLKPVEVVKTTWKCYIPATISGIMSTACIIGASSVNLKRNAALATAYTLSETALKEYQDKVVETLGEKKEQAVRDALAKDKIDKNPVTNREVIITERGKTLCYDVFSGRYFESDIELLKKAENKLNRQMMDEMYVSVNDLYYEIGLSGTQMGSTYGWNIDKGLIDMRFSSQLSEDDRPCLVVDYYTPPEYNFR